ncbi:YbjN domain-containing protein [Longispora sp. K20-0274]|uniref:T3SS (YopN, CesT) and YbjN peptide-binding chaperone 1 n=1 Tax=Longispora sp. K20-0274 TaxID=3088255 RepID=UPI00399969BB
MAIDDLLRTRVHGLVAGYLHGSVPSADLVEEPVAIRSGTAIVYVRLIDAEPAVVRVFSPLLREIDSGPELLAELNELNGRLSFLRLFWRDRTVYAAAELLAETLDEPELANACDSLADAADYYDEWLGARFGGVRAFPDRC